MKWRNMNLMLCISSFDFYGVIKLYLVMSCHWWSDMHCNHTSFVLWLFSSLNLAFSSLQLILKWRKNSTVASEKRDSMELLFNDYFCLSNLILQWVIPKLLLFLLGRKRCIYTLILPDFSFSFLGQY